MQGQAPTTTQQDAFDTGDYPHQGFSTGSEGGSADLRLAISGAESSSMVTLHNGSPIVRRGSSCKSLAEVSISVPTGNPIQRHCG